MDPRQNPYTPNAGAMPRCWSDAGARWVRLDRTTELQRAYLRAMAELGPGPQRAAAVAGILNRTTQQCGTIRSKLIEKGLLYQPQHGDAAFTVPHFDRHLKRTIPDLTVPPIRHRGP